MIMFSKELDTILRYAGDEAMRTGHILVQPDHLTLGLIRHKDNLACKIMKSLGVDLEAFKSILDKSLFLKNPIPYSENTNLKAAKETMATLNITVHESKKDKFKQAQSEHLLLALILNTMCFTWIYLKEKRIGYAEIKTVIEKFRTPHNSKDTLNKALNSSINAQLAKLFEESKSMTNNIS